MTKSQTIVLLLTLSYTIRGLFITVLPFTTLTLFDTAIPAQSASSLLGLGAVSIIAALMGFVIHSRCEGLLASTAKITIDDLRPELTSGEDIPAPVKQHVMSLARGKSLLVAEFLWTLAIVSFLYYISATGGLILTGILCVVALLSFLLGDNVAKGLPIVISPLLVFGSAFFVLRGEITLGVITFVLFTGMRILSNVGGLFASLTDIRNSFTSTDIDRVFNSNYFKPKMVSALATVFLSVFFVSSFVVSLHVPIQRAVTLTGNSLKETETIQIVSPVSGVILQASVKEGSRVAQGQVLYVLDSLADEQLEANRLQRDQLQRRLADTQDIYDNLVALKTARVEELSRQFENSAIRREQLLDAQIDLASTGLSRNQEIASLQQNLLSLKVEAVQLGEEVRSSIIVSPSSGTVDRSLAVANLPVSSGQEVMTIVPDGRVLVETFATPADRQYLTEGKPLILNEVLIGERETEDIPARVLRASEQLDSQTGLFRVLIETDVDIQAGVNYTAKAVLNDVGILVWVTDSFLNSIQGFQLR